MWLKTLIVFLVLHLSSATCGVGLANLPDKIVGGRNAEEGEFPWQASFQRYSPWLGSFYHYCGASLLNPLWLATAAHCVQSKTANSYRIVIGSNNLTSADEDETYYIHRIIIKKDYDPSTFDNDIALIELFNPVPDYLTPICLTTEPPETGSPAVVTGWGATSDGGRASEYLQAADVMIISKNSCMDYYPELTDSMTCAGYDEGGVDSCQVCNAILHQSPL